MDEREKWQVEVEVEGVEEAAAATPTLADWGKTVNSIWQITKQTKN